MDKIAREDFFAAILSSNILAPHLERDADLAELVKVPSHPDIPFSNHGDTENHKKSLRASVCL